MKQHFFLALLFCSALNSLASQAPLIAHAESTNAGGWQITLSASTNTFTIGQALAVTVTISNATSGTGHLNWSHSPAVAPGFGRLTVTNYDAPAAVDYVGPRWSWADDRSGSFGPTANMSFSIDLTEGYGLTNAGKYGVWITGNLRSPTNAEVVFEYSVPPLKLNLSTPSLPPDEASMRIPDR